MDRLKLLIQQKKSEKPQNLAPLPETPAPPPSHAQPLSQSDIISRLRKLKQPAKYFGESLEDQYNRLLKSEEDFISQKPVKEEEKINIALIEEIFPADRSLFTSSPFIDQAKSCQDCENSGKVWKKEKWKHPFIEESLFLDSASKSLIICLFWKTVLDQWQLELDPAQKPLFDSTVQTFKKLIQILKTDTLQDSVLNLLFIAVRFSQLQSFTKAYDTHFQISGLSSFHKNESRNGAVSSDIGFRKVAQTFKRIITLSEKFYHFSHNN